MGGRNISMLVVIMCNGVHKVRVIWLRLCIVVDSARLLRDLLSDGSIPTLLRKFKVIILAAMIILETIKNIF
jgi:hypothetical protein